jgi:hypothetical protein
VIIGLSTILLKWISNPTFIRNTQSAFSFGPKLCEISIIVIWLRAAWPVGALQRQKNGVEYRLPVPIVSFANDGE